MTKTTTVQTVDLWTAIDALPETHATDWYKRLVEAAEAATQAELIAKGRIEYMDATESIGGP